MLHVFGLLAMQSSKGMRPRLGYVDYSYFGNNEACCQDFAL